MLKVKLKTAVLLLRKLQQIAQHLSSCPHDNSISVFFVSTGLNFQWFPRPLSFLHGLSGDKVSSVMLEAALKNH